MPLCVPALASPLPARPQASAPASAGFASGGSAASGGGALAAFNAQFRAAAEAFDAREREQKAARKAAGKAALKKALAERKAAVDARKAKNREDETAKEREMLEAMSGEPWHRVFTMVDVHATPAAAGGAKAASEAESGGAGGGGKKKGDKHAEASGDLARIKDILIAVKNAPPPTAPGVSGV